MQAKQGLKILKKGSAQGERGSAVLLAAVSLMVLGTALVLSQATSVKSDIKATAYSTDQNLAQAAAAVAIAAGQTYINSFTAGTPPATCSSGTGCSTVYSSTALSGGAAAQTESWWTTSSNVKTTNIGTGCSDLSAAGNLNCAYAIERTSCSTTTGDITYKITGYGYFTGGSPGTYSSNITTYRKSSTLTKTVFATPFTGAVTYVNPAAGTPGTAGSLCPVSDAYWSTGHGTAYISTFYFFSPSTPVTTPSIVLNSSLTGSTFTSGSGTINTIGIAAQGTCNNATWTVTVKNVTTNQTSTVSPFSPGGSILYDACSTYSGYRGWSLKTASLGTPLAVSYGNTITVSMSETSTPSCAVASYTYNNATSTPSTTTTAVGPDTSYSVDYPHLIYSLTGTGTSGYNCP